MVSQKSPTSRTSFKRLMALKQSGPDTFESVTPAWPPNARAFGGYVYAQAAYAASKTVASGMFIHNVTGHFLLGGRVDIPFTYRVRRIRDGGSYCLRSVDVYQEQGDSTSTSNQDGSSQTPCFVATISFKRQESKTKHISFSHQSALPTHLQTTYRSVLDRVEPSSHPLSPAGDDVPWDELDRRKVDRDHLSEIFPGVEIRKVDMTAYHQEKGCIDGSNIEEYRQLCFYRIILDEEDGRSGHGEIGRGASGFATPSLDLNLHLAAHLYASDRNSLFLVQRAHNFQSHRTQMASLAHTVIFHGQTENLRMVDGDGEAKWFVQESWTSNGGENRGCHDSRLWEWKTGKVVGTTVQDGMMRILPKDGNGTYGDTTPNQEGRSRL